MIFSGVAHKVTIAKKIHIYIVIFTFQREKERERERERYAYPNWDDFPDLTFDACSYLPLVCQCWLLR